MSFKSAKESLAKVLRVPVDPVDFNLILSGRIPLHPHDYARLQQDPDRQEIVLTLEKGWDGVVEKLYLDKAARVVRQVEMFDASGSLSYRIEYQRYQAFGRIRMPGRLMISTEQGDRLRLDIGRYETDVPVDEGLFVLSPPP